MSGLRLDLIVRTYTKPGLNFGGQTHSRWTWRLWSGSRIVSTSGGQLYSRRIDCARGAEVGAGLQDVALILKYGYGIARRGSQSVPVRIIDERAKP